MQKKKRPLSEVSELPFYGRKFPFIPFRGITSVRVVGIFTRDLYGEFGLLRFLGFWLSAPFRLGAANRRFAEGFAKAEQSFGKLARFEWALVVIIYQAIERQKGKAAAYAFIKKAIQDASPVLMADLYPADLLAEFEDPFEAFWAYHKAMFTDDPNYPNEMAEKGDLRTMTMRSCMNCQLAALTIPDLAKLGCDHDVTGYPAIAERVQMEFRRPVTLAKDGKPCEFMFFRRGAPIDPGLETH